MLASSKNKNRFNIIFIKENKRGAHSKTKKIWIDVLLCKQTQITTNYNDNINLSHVIAFLCETTLKAKYTKPERIKNINNGLKNSGEENNERDSININKNLLSLA